VVSFGDAGGKLGLVVHNSPPIPMRAEHDALCLDFNRSATGPYRVAIEPGQAGNAAPDTILFEDGGTSYRLARLVEGPALAQAGTALAGAYRAPDLNADAAIAFDGNRLLLRIAGEHGPNLLELTPYSADVFGWKFTGDLAPLGGTLHVERSGDRVTGLRLNTLRTRHMHLQRIEA
jgi:D-aminopeptidase